MLTLKQNKWLALIGVSLTSIIVGADFTIVNTVLPAIAQQFSLTMNALQWVMTGFGITFSALLVSAGRLGDILGRRLVLNVGVVGFGLASAAAGLADTGWQLIVARICQGIFASVTFPCGMAIVAHAFKGEKQTRALGIYASFIGIGMAAGPVLGGFISSILNWRWIFLVNLPIVFISLTICCLSVTESRLAQKVTIDWLGMLLVSFGLGTLVFALTEVQVGGWVSWQVLFSFILSVLSFAGFVWAEKKTAEPLLPLQLLLNRSFLIGVMVYVVGISFTWSIMFFVPLYLQKILQFNAQQTGFMLLPMTLMTVIAPPLAAYLLGKKGPLIATLCAFIASIIGLILLLFVSANFSFLLLFLAFLGMGLSWGIANGIAVPITLLHLDNQQHGGLISGAASTILNVVGVIVLALATSLFYFVAGKQSLLAHQTAVSFLSGFHAVMLMLLILTGICLVVVLRVFKGLARSGKTTRF